MPPSRGFSIKVIERKRNILIIQQLTNLFNQKNLNPPVGNKAFEPNNVWVGKYCAGIHYADFVSIADFLHQIYGRT